MPGQKAIHPPLRFPYDWGVEDPKGRPAVPFERIRPGDDLGTFTYELTPEMVERHLRATDQEPYPDPHKAPVSILATDGVELSGQFWDISQSVHAGQRTEIVRIPEIGEKLCVRGTARDRFVKKGRRYVVSDITTSDVRGEVVARGVTTGVLVYSEGQAEAGDARPRSDPEPVPEARPVLRRLEPLVREMTLEKMILYEPPGEQNIHTDEALARGAGLPAPIATGTLFLAYVFDRLYRSYGFDSVAGTAVDVRIRRPVFAGDRIETDIELVSREGERHEHDVRCRGPQGDVIAGRAWVPVA
jgi:acyl dehydratase